MPSRPADLPGLAGWASDDAAESLTAYLATVDSAGPSWPRPSPGQEPRAFFETAFRLSAPQGEPGWLTGYFEPEFEAALCRDDRHHWPLHACPPDLAADRPWYSRTEIEAGGLLAGRELAWLADPLDAFLAQVQGSVRLRMTDGRLLRLGYAGRNGHPYRSIGAELVARGIAPAAEMTLDHIRQWARDHAEEVPDLLRLNPSYVFFRPIDLPPDLGPIGAMGQPLVAGRSLAADPDLIPPGAPVWVSALGRLMVAQDRGSAIRGPNRGDVFCGSGPEAGLRAGRLRTRGHLRPLLPAGPETAR